MVSAVLLGSASLVRQPLDQISRWYNLVPRGAAKHPELKLLRLAPGGLRGPILSYFWMRSQALHREGQHSDAMLFSRLICNLQPRCPSVWQFQAWQLAWNISAAAHTKKEGWHWVGRGISLLRDEGIPKNPHSLLLYKQLSWIFATKIGDETDDNHRYYKQKWAQKMQELLGAQPYATTREVLAAFKAIADAPVDKDSHRGRGSDIQDDVRRRLLRENPDLAAYAEELAAVGLKVDRSLLAAYNLCTQDVGVAVTRIESPQAARQRLRKQAESIADPAERDSKLEELSQEAKWTAVINNPTRADARRRLLAFVRAQILWNVHKMDPEYMYGLMGRFGPIDWRLPWSHGLYWSVYGVEHCKGITKANIDWLNTDRTRLMCLKNLTWRGNMTYVAKPRTLDDGEALGIIHFRSDWRFIEATHQEYLRLATEQAKIKNRDFVENPLDSGHVNYLANTIAALFINGRHDEAKRYLDWVKVNYKKTDGPWAQDDLEGFVFAQLGRDGAPIPRVAISQITSSLQMAFVLLAKGDVSAFAGNLDYAGRVYRTYQKSVETAAGRLTLRPMEYMAASIAAELLVRPRRSGFDLSLIERSNMYTRLKRRWPEAVARAYKRICDSLTLQCKAAGLDFDTRFPKPEGPDAVRQQRANIP